MDVQIRCICPPTEEGPRHEQDTVTLRDKLDFLAATAIRKATGFAESDDETGRAAEIYARLTEGYVLFGIEGWTVVDERGKPVPLSHSAIRSYLLAAPDAASEVGDAADVLYAEAILLPLLRKASSSSLPTPTKRPTSARRGSSEKPTPLRRSSTSTTRTDDTETTSSVLDGVSSSSQNSVSAA